MLLQEHANLLLLLLDVLSFTFLLLTLLRGRRLRLDITLLLNSTVRRRSYLTGASAVDARLDWTLRAPDGTGQGVLADGQYYDSRSVQCLTKT